MAPRGSGTCLLQLRQEAATKNAACERPYDVKARTGRGCMAISKQEVCDTASALASSWPVVGLWKEARSA